MRVPVRDEDVFGARGFLSTENSFEMSLSPKQPLNIEPAFGNHREEASNHRSGTFEVQKGSKLLDKISKNLLSI